MCVCVFEAARAMAPQMERLTCSLVGTIVNLSLPNHHQRCAKMEAQSNIVHILDTQILHFCAISAAQSVIINKISASELSRKFIKSALLVGLTIYGTRRNIPT